MKYFLCTVFLLMNNIFCSIPPAVQIRKSTVLNAYVYCYEGKLSESHKGCIPTYIIPKEDTQRVIDISNITKDIVMKLTLMQSQYSDNRKTILTREIPLGHLLCSNNNVEFCIYDTSSFIIPCMENRLIKFHHAASGVKILELVLPS